MPKRERRTTIAILLMLASVAPCALAQSVSVNVEGTLVSQSGPNAAASFSLIAPILPRPGGSSGSGEVRVSATATYGHLTASAAASGTLDYGILSGGVTSFASFSDWVTINNATLTGTTGAAVGWFHLIYNLSELPPGVGGSFAVDRFAGASVSISGDGYAEIRSDFIEGNNYDQLVPVAFTFEYGTPFLLTATAGTNASIVFEGGLLSAEAWAEIPGSLSWGGMTNLEPGSTVDGVVDWSQPYVPAPSALVAVALASLSAGRRHRTPILPSV